MTYTPELGQAVFGQPYKEYECSALLEAALEAISNEWERVMGNIEQKEVTSPFRNVGDKWSCDTFEVESYSWNEDYRQPYNFKWKDFEVSWYKYLGRGMSQNRPISNDEISEMLDDCLAALREEEKRLDTQF